MIQIIISKYFVGFMLSTERILIWKLSPVKDEFLVAMTLYLIYVPLIG